MKTKLTHFLIGTFYALSGTTFSSAQEAPDIPPLKKISVGVFVQPDFSIGSGHFWKDTKSGTGLTQNLGFGVKGDYYLNEKSALSLIIGAAEWTLIRNYTEEKEFVYRENAKLFRAQITAGYKYYFANKFYFMPEAGASLLGLTTLSTEFGEEVESGKSDNFTYSAGGAIGFEHRIGRFLIDIAPRYQYWGYEKGQFVSVRAAVSYILR